MRQSKYPACLDFFFELATILQDTHTVVGSCNKDSSLYLVPIGTEDQITYYSKPKYSFRVSDHWNWYANLRKCDKEHYIQCLSVDVPYPRKREAPGKASKPIFAEQVAMIGNDGKYHAIFGERWDRNTKKWEWISAIAFEVRRRLYEETDYISTFNRLDPALCSTG